MERKQQLIVIGLATLACLLWSTAFAGIKIGLAYCSPLLFAGIRFLFAGLMLIPFSGNPIKYLNNYRKNFKLIFILAIFQTFLLYGMMFIGMTLIDGAIVAIVNGASPMIIAIVTHFAVKDDKLSARKIVVILTGFSGIVLIAMTQKPFTKTGMLSLLGILLILLGFVSTAIANLIVRYNKKELNPLFLNSAQIATGGMMLILISIPIEGASRLNITPQFVGVLSWLSFLSATAFSIWYYLLTVKKIKVSSLNIWNFIIPVFGAIWSWLLLPDESPKPLIITGMCIVALSLVIYNLPNRTKTSND